MRIKWFTGFLILLLCCLLKIPVSAEEPSKLLYQELKYKDSELEVVVSGDVPENATLYVHKYNDVTYEGNDNNYYSDFGINLSITVDDELWNPSSDNSVLNVCIVNGKDYINDADNFTCYYLGDNSKVSNARIVDNNIVFSTNSIGIYTFGKTEHSSLSQRTFVRRIGKYTITISGKMPDDANPVVEQVYNYNELENKIDNDDYNIELAFNIKIMSCGEEWQPIDYGEELTVTVSNLDIEAGEDEEIKVYRVIDEEQMDSLSEAAVENNVQEIEQMDSKVSDDNCIISFETDHFTVYTFGIVQIDSDKKIAYLKDGLSIETILKSLVGLDSKAADSKITAINFVDTEFTSDNIISVDESPYPVYARLNETVIELYTIADEVYLNKYSSYIFFNFTAATTIDTSKFNTSKVKYFERMFSNCTSLNNLEVSHFNTSNATDTKGMFSGCKSLTNIGVDDWDMHNVTDMSYMFEGCASIVSIDLNEWDTSNVIQLYNLFADCTKLSSVAINKLDIHNATSLKNMFYNCVNLTTINLNGWDTSNVTELVNTFKGCTKLISVDVSTFNTSNVIDMTGVFTDCKNLVNLDISNWDTSNVVSMSKMFKGCKKLTNINYGEFNHSKVRDMSGMYSSASNYNFPDNFNTSKVTNLSEFFNGAGSVKQEWIDRIDTSSCTNMSYMFTYDTVSGISITNWDTSHVTNMSYMFTSTKGLETFDYGEFDMSSVTNVNYMYSIHKPNDSKYQTDIYNIKLPDNFNTSKCIRLEYLFYSRNNITQDIVDMIDTSNAERITSMFEYCSFDTIDVSHFNTSKVTHMSGVFKNCKNLKELDLSNWDAISVITAANSSDIIGNDTSITKIKSPKNIQNKASFNLYVNGKYDGWYIDDVEPYGTPEEYKSLTKFKEDSSSHTYINTYAEGFESVAILHDGCTLNAELKKVTNKAATLNTINMSVVSITALDKASVSSIPSALLTTNISDGVPVYVARMGMSLQETVGAEVVHSSNIDDDGKLDSKYSSYSAEKQVITVPGADHLDITITYGTEENYDFVYVYSGNCTQEISRNMTGYTKKFTGYKSTKNTESFTISGNTATFIFYSDMSSEFYGYYAEVNGIGYTESKPTLVLITEANEIRFNQDSRRALSYFGVLEEIYLDDRFTFDYITDMSGMFKGCPELKELDLSESNLLNLTKADDVFTGTGLLKVKSPNRIADGVTISLPDNGDWYIDDSAKFNKADTNDKQTSFDCNRSHTYISSLHPDFKPATQVAMFYYGLNENVLLKSLVNPDLKQTVEEIDDAYDWHEKCDIVDNKITNITWSDIPFDTSMDGVKLVGENRSIYEPLYGRAVKNTKRDTITKISHTDNVSDNGNNSGRYAANTTKTETVTIPGAKSITVDLSYSMDSNTTVSIYKGTDTSGELLGTYSDYVTTVAGILQLGSLKQSTLNVDGDSVTIVFTAGSNNSSIIFRPQRFGYYAKVYGEGDVELDTYTIELYTEADIVYTGNCIDHLFNNFQALEHIDILSSKIVLNQKTITSDHIFRNDYSLIDVDLSRFDFTTFFKGYDEGAGFDRVPTLNGLFERCSSLTYINFDNVNTSKIEDMNSMFSGCTSLQNVDLSNFDTSSVKDFALMFAGCVNLEDINLSNFDTTSATNMSGMFFMCSKLNSIDVSNFNTDNVVQMFGMFAGCASINSLDISNMNLPNVEDMSYMFAYCLSIEEIRMPDTNIPMIYPGMFVFTPHLSKLYGLQNVNTIYNNSFALNMYIPKENYNTIDDEFKYMSQYFSDIVTITDVGDYYYLQSVEPSSKVILQFPDYKQYKSDCWLNYDWALDNRAVCEYEVTTPAIVDLESAEMKVDIRSYVGQENIDVNVNKVNTLSSVVDNSKKLNLYLKASDRDKSTSSLTGKYNLKDLAESEDNISYITPVKEKDNDGIYNMHEKYIFNFIRESSPDLGEYNGSIGIEFSKDVGALNAG